MAPTILDVSLQLEQQLMAQCTDAAYTSQSSRFEPNLTICVGTKMLCLSHEG